MLAVCSSVVQSAVVVVEAGSSGTEGSSVPGPVGSSVPGSMVSSVPASVGYSVAGFVVIVIPEVGFNDVGGSVEVVRNGVVAGVVDVKPVVVGVAGFAVAGVVDVKLVVVVVAGVVVVVVNGHNCKRQSSTTSQSSHS